MDELRLTILSRAGDAAFDPERATETRLALFDRPERYVAETPVEASAITGLRIEFQQGARLRLHSLVLRPAGGGGDVYRWAGAGELFRDSRGLRFWRREGAVGIECVEAGGGFTIGCDPTFSGLGLEVLLTVSADGPSAASGELAPDSIVVALNHIHGRLETLSADTSRLHAAGERQAQTLERLAEDLARSQSGLHEAVGRLQEVAAEHAQQISHMRTEEGLRHAALTAVLDHRLESILAHERSRSAEAEARLAEHREVIAAQATQIHALTGSSSWRITAPLRGLVRLVTGQRAAAPAPSRRLATDEVTVAEPLRTRQRPEPRAVRFPAAGEATTLAELRAEPPRTLDLTVSVIIPTFNAGAEFYWLLRKLKAQQGLAAVEVVVVDSGSTDGTDTLAEEFGCKVVRIPNSEFSHSHARNLGADNATGDLYLFTVQDAYPVGDGWLQSLALALTEPASEDMRAAAVSCSEFPRRDSELLYNAAIDTHYRFLGCRDGDRIGRMVTDDHHSLRTQGQLSDVACLIPAETFQKYRYQGRYAEDLMLGVRLLRDGLRTAMLSSVRVIHSHNRAPAYHLKRTFVDVVFLTEVFPDFDVPAASSAAGAAAAAAMLAPLADEWWPAQGADAAEALRAFSTGVRATPVPATGGAGVDFGFAPLRPWLDKAIGRKDARWRAEAEQVRNMYADRLDHLAGFVARSYGEVDDHLAAELAAAARKTLAATVGAQLAFLYLHGAREGGAALKRQVEELRTLMTAGI